MNFFEIMYKLVVLLCVRDQDKRINAKLRRYKYYKNVRRPFEKHPATCFAEKSAPPKKRPLHFCDVLTQSAFRFLGMHRFALADVRLAKIEKHTTYKSKVFVIDKHCFW